MIVRDYVYVLSVHSALMSQQDTYYTYNVTLRRFHVTSVTTEKQKKAANPLQAWTGPEGSRSLRLPDFKTIGT